MTTPTPIRWLPGMLAVGSLYVLLGCAAVYTVITQHAYTRQGILIAILGGMLVAGGIGLLAMQRWGWALCTAGAVMIASVNIYNFVRLRQPGFLIFAAANAVIFLYLVRTSVRERTH